MQPRRQPYSNSSVGSRPRPRPYQCARVRGRARSGRRAHHRAARGSAWHFRAVVGRACPTCGGVLDITTSLKDVHKEPYECALCCRSFELSLDEMADRDAVPVLQDDREKPWAELGIDYEHRVLTRLAQSLSSPTSCGRGGLGERLRVAFLRGEQNAQYASQVTTPHRAGRPIVGKAGFPRPTVSPCGQTPLCLVKLRQGPRTIT